MGRSVRRVLNRGVAEVNVGGEASEVDIPLV